MATNWTDGQLKAIDLRHRNILVAAAAGSGKTAVLVERIIRMITDSESPIDIDRLLVVTFTNAAAAQMKERIGIALEKRLNEEPENVHLQRQLTLLNHAKITTIHSFCLYLVRNYFDRLDIDPDFRIADEGETKLLKADIMKALLEEAFEKTEPSFIKLVESYATGKNDTNIEGYIEQLDKFAEGYPFPEEQLDLWYEDLSKTAPEELMQTEWMKCLMRDVKLQLEELCESYENAARLCVEDDGPDYYLPMIEADLDIVRKLSKASDYRELNDELKKIEFVRKPGKKKITGDVAKKEYVSAVRDRCKDSIKDLQKRYCIESVEELSMLLKQQEEPLKALVLLAREYGTRYAAAKKEKNIVDFGDLEHFALKILTDKADKDYIPSEVADDVSRMFEEILVDEYQDSNRVQEIILKCVSRERFNEPNIFMVGDVKQSIYKFRLARPELFLEKYNTYTTEDSSYQKIDLHMNFRSRRAVLDSANYIFEQIMTKKLGNIVYDEAASLYAGADYPESDNNPAAELLIIDTGKDAMALLDKDSDYQKRELEAMAIAGKIKQLTDSENGFKIYDRNTDTMRTARYSDIVILLRSFTGWAEVFVNTLADCGIPAFAESQTGYFDALEVRTVLDLLNVIDNPLQDIPLAAVLKSPIGRLTNIDLANILALFKNSPKNSPKRVVNASEDLRTDFIDSKASLNDDDEQGVLYLYKDSTDVEGNSEITKLCEDIATDKDGALGEFVYNASGLYGACMYYIDYGTDESLKEKLVSFFSMREEFEKMALYMKLDELLGVIMTKSGYFKAASVMPGGKVRQANLQMLIEKAAEFEKTSYHGLFNFIRYIENLKKYSVDFGEASVIGENDNIVRLTTIHKSKGLEYPIVIIGGMGKKFNMQDSNSRILFEPDLGIAADSVNLDKRVRTATLAKKVLQRQMILSSMGEELRILYVAMTRAKEKLIMTGCEFNISGLIDKWSVIKGITDTQMPYTYLSKARSYMDWVVMGLMRHNAMSDFLHKQFGEPIDSSLYGNNSARFEISLINPLELINNFVTDSFVQSVEKDELLNWDSSVIYDKAAADEIHSRLSFTYSKADELNMHTKVSVSELKINSMDIDESELAGWVSEDNVLKTANDSGELRQLPKFLQEQTGTSGAFRGTAMHRFMELIDFKEAAKHISDIKAFVSSEKERYLANGRLTKELYDCINDSSVVKFFDSSLAKRMMAAAQKGKLFKEKQFVMGIPAHEIGGEYSGDELILIQGIVDVYFEEDNELVVVDYKTDSVNNADELVKRYKTQLDYYKQALEQISGKKVSEEMLYSFKLGEEIEIK